MAGRGPAPKSPELRQRTNKKPGADTLTAPEIPTIPELMAHPMPGRDWHPYTLLCWGRAWGSAMASKWLPSEFDGLFRLAMKWDDYYVKGSSSDLAEIRLQEQRYGLSPLDRSRLQWEVNRGEEADRKLTKRKEPPAPVVGDPRDRIRMVK